MRFCPFCSAENADESAACSSCGRRLPPLPPRRAGTKGPPTGVSLPPRATSPTSPPPIPRKPPTAPPPLPEPTIVDARESAPALPPPPAEKSWPADDSSRAQLRNAIAPGPAALRREPPPPQPAAAGPARRKSDSKAPPLPPTRPGDAPRPLSPSAFARPPVPLGTPAPMVNRSGSLPQPAIDRAKSPSRPPPLPRPLDNFGGETEIDPNAGMGHVEPSPLDRSGVSAAAPWEVAPARADSAMEPPPTRIHRPEAADRPFTPPRVNPVPEIPEPGLVHAAQYAYQFALARWQRRGAIKTLGVEIKQDTEALDQVLGALGRAARGARVEGRVFSAENAAITAAEERVAALQRESGEVEGRKAEENSKFVDVERERNEKLVEAERMVEEAQRELQHLEAQRRSLRDKRKELDRRQKAFLKNADDHERQAGAAPLGDQRQELRRAAEGHRKEAAAIEPDKQEIDRRLSSLERPISEATARLDAAKAELDAAKRSLSDAREGHTHRLAELDAEQKRKAREVGLAEAEIQRRLVTLGTLVNLNRIEDPQFAELYQRIDRIRGAITARTTEIEKLTAEREAYDRGTLVRGVATIGGAFVALIALIVILRAVL